MVRVVKFLLAFAVLVFSGIASASTAPTTPTFMLSWGSGPGFGPAGVATDALGNVYVADQNNNRIQKFDRFGNLILQWGSLGSGDGQLNFPAGVAIDVAGNVFVVDEFNNRIQKFTTAGVYLDQWGSGGTGNGQFAVPFGIAVDAAGNVYVADQSNDRIQKFTGAGAYLGQWGSTGAGNGQFNRPVGVATDPAGNVYVADYSNRRIQKFTAAGAYVSQWGSIGSGNGQFNSCSGLASDPVGNIYVVDQGNTRIEKFSGSGAYLTQFDTFSSGVALGIDAAGNLYVSEGTSLIEKFSGAGAELSEPPNAFLLRWGFNGSGNGQFNHPLGVATDLAGNVYVGDGLNQRVQKFTGTGTYTTQWGSPGSGDGQFNGVDGVAIDVAGNVFVADQFNNRIQKFTNTGGYLNQWGSLGSGNGQLTNPLGVTTDAIGNVYVADYGNNRMQEFTGQGSYLRQWGSLGSGIGQFNFPAGPAIDAAGNVYVADANNHRIQKFTSTGAFLAQWGSEGTGDGQFRHPFGVALDVTGNLYVADRDNDRIQKFTSSGAYLGQFGSSGTANGQFVEPIGIATDVAGNVYVSDWLAARIHKFVSPPAIALVSDVRNDQGRQVRLRILRSSADSPASGTSILRYDIYRRIDALPGPTLRARDLAAPAGAQLAGWEQVGSISARGDAEYNVVVPTLADATPSSFEYSAFFVSAATADPFVYYDSGVENGVSVDNLPPPSPAPFTATYLAGATSLHWGMSTASDFATFRLYRGASADFVPGPGNLVAATPDTGLVDAGAAGSFYKLSAVDRNGNESAFALVGPGQTTDAPDHAPVVFALEGVRPNPSHGGRMVVSFALTSSRPATLELIDLAGRRVLERAVGVLGAGRHAVELAPTSRLAPGAYFLRLSQGADARVVRIAVLN